MTDAPSLRSPADDTRMKAIPCIVCRRELTGCSVPNQPLDGLAFSSCGHYGTTAFDPMDGSALEINVCDPCLTEAGARGRVLLYPAGGFKRGKPKRWRNDETPRVTGPAEPQDNRKDGASPKTQDPS